MINKTELRIGNLVYSDGLVGAIENGWELDEGRELFPIPLVPYYLAKAGFEKGNSSSETISHYSKDQILITFREDLQMFFLSNFETNNPHGMRYVHQLQNLYFALTGKELVYD